MCIAVLTEEDKLHNSLTVCFIPLTYSGADGSPLDILTFLSWCPLEYVSWFLVGWKFGLISLCREKTLLSFAHNEDGRNEVLQIWAEFPVHWQNNSAVVSMTTELHGSHYNKGAKYICLYFDFFHMCIPCGSSL